MSDDFVHSPFEWSQQIHGKRALAFDAFISHATGDRSSALVEDLRRHGVKVWHDESQEMGDAMWSTRLVNALLRSRYVVLVMDAENDVLEREWVKAEWQSALEAERVSGVQRAVIARSTAAHVSPALSMHPQFNIPDQSEALAKILKDGNQLPDYVIVNNDPPSFTQIYASLEEVALREVEGGKIRQLYELIATGLLETQSYQNHPSYAVYVLSVFSHDSQALDELEINSLGPAVQGLEALAITGHYESRANSCFMLRALAKRGCVEAGEALRNVLRRQDHDRVLELLYRWFVDDGETFPPLAREDYTRILLLLPSTAHELVDKASELSPPEADAAKLRHAVFRSTYKHFEKLKPTPKRHEAERRFQILLENAASPSTWEVFFRGLSIDADLKSPMVDLASPPPEEGVDTFLTLVERFADEGARSLGNGTWYMQYELAILQPLAIVHAHKQFGERPLLAYRKVLEALKRPVREDIKLIEEWQSEQFTEEDSQFASLLREELEARLASIAFYLQGLHVETKDYGLTYVNWLDSTARLEIGKVTKDLAVKRMLLESLKQPLADFEGSVSGGGSKHPTIVTIWDRWSNVPL